LDSHRRRTVRRRMNLNRPWNHRILRWLRILFRKLRIHKKAIIPTVNLVLKSLCRLINWWEQISRAVVNCKSTIMIELAVDNSTKVEISQTAKVQRICSFKSLVTLARLATIKAEATQPTEKTSMFPIASRTRITWVNNNNKTREAIFKILRNCFHHIDFLLHLPLL